MTNANDGANAQNGRRSGKITMGVGCLFGLAPMAISVIALFFGSGIGNVLHWYTLYTAPIGLGVFLVGLVIAMKQSQAKRVSVTSSNATQIDHVLKDTISIRFTVGSTLALVSALAGLAFPVEDDSIAVSNVVVIVAALSVGISARRLKTRAHLSTFRNIQLVGSIASILVNIGIGLGLVIALTGIYQGSDPYVWTGPVLVSFVGGIVAITLAVMSIVYTNKLIAQTG